MDIKEIKTYLGSDWEKVQSLIASVLGSDIDLLNKVNGTILSNGGKQLRPVLALLVARACGTVTEDSIRYAAAGELLHNATLLHDDVADRSDRRRGKPTVYSLLGPSVSVLVGDYWLEKAVGCILDAENHGDEVIRLFSKTLSDLAEGEMLQLQKAETCDTDEAVYLRIIYSKTASLFKAAAVSAAISVGASKEIRDAVETFAVNLGLAFQIRDDIFDYSLGMNIGKPVGADILERKITLPLLGAFRNAGPEAETAMRARIRTIEENPSVREEVCSFVRENGGTEYAQSRLGDFTDKALEALAVLPGSEARDMLSTLVRYVGNRKI